MVLEMKLGYGSSTIGDRPWHLNGARSMTDSDIVEIMLILMALDSLEINIVDTAYRYGGGLSHRIIDNGAISGNYNVFTKIELDNIETMTMQYAECVKLKKLRGIMLHNPDLSKITDRHLKWLESLATPFRGISTEPCSEVVEIYEDYDLNLIQFPASKKDQRFLEGKFNDFISKRTGVLTMANSVLGGPDPFKLTETVEDMIGWIGLHRELIDVALVGCSTLKHFMECVNFLSRPSYIRIGDGSINEKQ